MFFSKQLVIAFFNRKENFYPADQYVAHLFEIGDLLLFIFLNKVKSYQILSW